jgi:hypothetical protein
LDSYFKVGVEFDFVNNLRECDSVVYLSATPMLDKYLDRLDDFKDYAAWCISEVDRYENYNGY